MNSGEGDGGSTGWSAAFRSRLYFRATAPEQGDQPDPNARTLQRRKANYAARNDEIRLSWRQGVIEPEEAPKAAGVTAFGKLAAEDVFLHLMDVLDAQQRPMSATPRAGNFAPRVLDGLPREERHGYRFADFKKAMERLFFTHRIEVVPYGRPSKGMHKIARAK